MDRDEALALAKRVKRDLELLQHHAPVGDTWIDALFYVEEGIEGLED